uniref:Glycoprotein n=1 Tax=Parabronema skrjabini TaxID=499165 RepID=A0A3Q9NCB9_9BILA|nr:glycoprotein [Parabronema skrjabini]
MPLFGITAAPQTSSTVTTAAAPTLTPALTTGFTFGSTAPAVTVAEVSTAQPAMGTTTTAAPILSFGSTAAPVAAATTVAPTGFTFGQMAIPTTALTPSTIPLSTTPSLLSSVTSATGATTTTTVTSAGSTLSSLLFPSKTTAPTALPIAPTTTVSTVIPPTTSTSLAAATVSPAAATASTIATDKPITFAQLEQLVNRLTLDVEAQQRVFMSQVLELNAYDRVLRENQQKVLAVGEEIKQLEEEKDRFLHTVDFISQQQAELETLVVDLEKALGLGDWTEMTPISLPDPGVATQADMQRQAMLQLQLQIDAQLKQADDDVSDIIEQVKELQRTATGTDEEAETADQIAQILRRQLDALQWIDEQSSELKKKATKLSQELSIM